MPELEGVKLGWEGSSGQWRAVLETRNEITDNRLVELFGGLLKGIGERAEFQWSDAVKSASTNDFRRTAGEAVKDASPGDHSLADWFESFASELVHKEGIVESTPFDMTVARQLFLADARWLTKSLGEADPRHGDALNLASFREALFGPWKYADNQHSLGWDPGTKLMGAFTPKAPTAMSKAGVRAAVWLAMESLPLFPCFFDRGLATCGFARKGRKVSFEWPVWEEPLSMAAVRILLAQTPGIDPNEGAGRGLAAVYASVIYKPNKYLTCFQAAALKA